MAAFSHQALLHDPLLYTPNQPSPLFSSYLIYSDLSTTAHDTSSSVEEPQSEKVVMGRKRKNTECKEGKRRMKKSKEEDQSKQEPTPPTGFIHVRARRGQATDSHSLAERVRREKISERMKLLQGLVPGCDKVIGKALMLDEIINYVQSLQHQVEFLSMKLASTNPSLYEYDFGVDLDGYMVQTQKQESNNQAMAFVGTYPMLDTSVAFPQGPSTLPQEHGGLVMHLDEPNQRFFNQLQFNNICSLQ